MSQKKKILIIGGSGFVGTNLAKALSEKHHVIATYHRDYSRVPNVEYQPFVGLGDKDLCAKFVETLAPEIVIYAAGSHDLARGEKDPNNMIITHTNGANHMLIASDYLKAKFILISSDYVFSGTEGNYSEGDTAIPLNSLGKAKLGAENYIRSRSLNHVIIRCAPLLGRGTLDHPSWLDQLRETEMTGANLTISKLKVHNPVHIRELGLLIERIIESDIRNKTLHLGGLTKLTLFDLATRFMKDFDLDETALAPIETVLDTGYQDFSLNFSQTLRLLKTEPLLLEQSLDLLK